MIDNLQYLTSIMIRVVENDNFTYRRMLKPTEKMDNFKKFQQYALANAFHKFGLFLLA